MSDGDEPYSGDEPEQFLIFLRSLKAGDWDRFDFYAPRIRRFGISQFNVGKIEVDKDVFHAFRRFGSARVPLLPNLRHVKMDLNSDFLFLHPSLRPLLLTPTLTSIHVISFYDQGSSKFGNLNSSILRLSPYVQHFQFSLCGTPLNESKSPIFPLLRKLHDLRTISLPFLQLPRTLVAHLSSLSSLTTLKAIRIRPSDIAFFRANRFSSLTEFSMVTDGWSSATAILDTMGCSFKSLYVHSLPSSISREESIAAFQTFVERLRPSFESLLTIDLGGSKVVLDDSRDAAEQVSDVIRPLFSCKSLRFVKLKFDFLEVLDDSWLLEAATAWPLLEKLELSPGCYPIPPNPKLTFTGLVSLIKLCPTLQDISLRLDITTLNPALLDGVCSAHLHRLSLDHPVPTSRTDLIQSLENMFPKMSCFWSSPNSTGLRDESNSARR